MVESYNRVITLLLLVALAVTFLGTVVTYNSILEKQGKSVSWLSGAATSTSTGQTNLTITSSTSITNRNFVIQFGSGNVNSTCDFCQMDTNGVSYSIYTSLPNATGGGCCGTWNYTQTAGFLLENTGNNNISVGYTCSGNCTHASFIGGTLFLGMGVWKLKSLQTALQHKVEKPGLWIQLLLVLAAAAQEPNIAALKAGTSLTAVLMVEL